MGSYISRHLSNCKEAIAGGNVNVPTITPPNEISDGEALALINSPSKQQLGYSPDGDYTPNAWRVSSDTVLKSTDWRSFCEPYMMMLVASTTSIPVPKVRKYICSTPGDNWIFMEYVEGRTLDEAWPTLSITRKLWVAWTLRGYICQLRRVPMPVPGVPGPLDGSGEPQRCIGHFFTELGTGPFASYAELSAWYNKRADNAVWLDRNFPRDRKEYPVLSRDTLRFDDSAPLVLTHGDLSLRNLMLGNDGKLWVIDWGFAGFYPQWMEYAAMMKYDFENPPSWRWPILLITGWYQSQYLYLKALGHALMFYD